MSQINEVLDPLVGGVSHLEIAPVHWVQSFPNPVGSGISELGISLKEGFNWLIVPYIHGTARYSEKDETTEHGQVIRKEIVALIPHDDLNNRTLFSQLALQDCVVRYRDHQRHKKVAATLEEPMQLLVDFTTAEFAGQIGFSIRLNSTGTQRSYFQTQPVLPQFYINSDGQLIYEGGLSETFAIDNDGKLTATGANANRYQQNNLGQLLFI